MNRDQYVMRREAIVIHPFTGKSVTYSGEQLHGFTSLGIVFKVSDSRIFVPWSKIQQLSYHKGDTEIDSVLYA